MVKKSFAPTKAQRDNNHAVVSLKALVAGFL